MTTFFTVGIVGVVLPGFSVLVGNLLGIFDNGGGLVSRCPHGNFLAMSRKCQLRSRANAWFQGGGVEFRHRSQATRKPFQ